MNVNSYHGKKVPILVLKDKFLVFCIPLLVLNAFVFLVYQLLLRPYIFVLAAISKLVLRRLSFRRLINIPALMLVNCASQLGLLCLSFEGTVFAWFQLLLVLLNIVTLMMCLVAIGYTLKNQFGVRTDLVFRLSSLDSRPALQQPLSWPSGLDVVELSRGIFLGSLLTTVLVLYNLGTIVLADSFSIAFWLSVHSLVLITFLIDFEVIEHLSAHSQNGRVAKLSKKSLPAIGLLGLEILRKYIVWPLFFWLPNFYYHLHTYHHHVENNGPADWQSTIRFDLSSFLDFTKSLNMLQFSILIPVDTLRYFTVMNRFRLRRSLMLGCARGYFLIVLVILIEPFCAVVPMILQLGRSWVVHQFTFAWHGFHDATRPYDIEASNNSYEHYAHHKKPGVHIFSEEILEIYHRNAADPQKQLALHKTDVGYYMVSNHWLLIQALLWQRKFWVVRKLIECDQLTDAELERLVSGCKLVNRHPIIQRIDLSVSYLIGRTVEIISRAFLPVERRNILT